MRKTVIAALVLLALFGCAALVLSVFVDVGAEDVRRWLLTARRRPALVFVTIVVVLATDSVLAIPTVATVLAAGYLLGPLWGALSALLGVMSAGLICYAGGRLAGSTRWVKAHVLGDIRRSVGEVGPIPLLLARTAPMLPEVLSTMAGASGMPARKYCLYFALANLPFALAVAYAGSISTVEQPWPAVVVAAALPAVLGSVALWRRRRRSAARHGERAVE